jgi:hypothetical protein
LSCIEHWRKDQQKHIYLVDIDIQQRIELHSINQCIDRLDILILLDRLRLRMGYIEYNFRFDIGNLLDSEHLHMDQLERIVYFDKYIRKYKLDNNKYCSTIDIQMVVVGVEVVYGYHYSLDRKCLRLLLELRLIKVQGKERWYFFSFFFRNNYYNCSIIESQL